MKRLALLFALIAGLAGAVPASAATTTQLRSNANYLVNQKCYQISTGCHGVTYESEASYYSPAGGFYAGSRLYRYHFYSWATYLNSNTGRYDCTVYVRNTTSASGLVNCTRTT